MSHAGTVAAGELDLASPPAVRDTARPSYQ
jgi:hypothetical protein